LNEALKQKVIQFLRDFKQLAQTELYVVPREVNKQALIDLGLTYKDRYNTIMSLATEDYSSGPEPDTDQIGFIWCFGKDINGVEVYIKLKIVEYIPVGTTIIVRKAKCISFHRAKMPLVHPLL
jgi:hypothetical protein